MPALIALATFAAFLPTLQNQFVNFDDDTNLLDNPHYRGLGWTQLRWMWTAFHVGHYIPLTWMTFGLDYVLWGMNPVGYHLTSVLLHAANAVAFYFVAFRLLALAWPGVVGGGTARLALAAGVAALLFAIHPLRVESVAWATERRDVLSGLFYLLTILVYLRACERGERDRGEYWLSVGLFGCALLSKSMAVSLPVVLLILDAYPLRRLGGAIGWWGKPARRVYLEKIPFVLLAAAASVIAFLALVRLQNMSSLERLSLLGRLAISAFSLSLYLWKTLVPLNLSPLYPLPIKLDLWAIPFVQSYGVVLAVTALVVACRRRLPGLPAVWLVYVVILLPVLGIFHNGPQIAADRYTYLAGLGWAILAGASLLSSRQATRFLLPGSAICVVVGLGVLTWNQAQVWHDSEKLWSHGLAIDPNSFEAQNNMGGALARQGKLAAAIVHFEQALQIKPDHSAARNNLGAALVQHGRWAEAIEHLEQAARIRPGNADIHYNWGFSLAQQGQPAEAIEHFELALKIRPHDADAHYRWGQALAQQGQPAEAIEHYREALKIRPDYAEALNNWGLALAQQGKLAEAVEQYRKALEIKPDFAAALTNWGNALARQGRPAEAIEHYRKALEIKPDFADAHNNWGNALALQGKPAEAIEHYQRALKLRPIFPEAQSNLVNALRRLGMGSEDPASSRKGQKAE